MLIGMEVKTGIILAVVLIAGLLIISGSFDTFFRPEGGRVTLGDILDDYDSRTLSFRSYEDGDVIAVRDIIEEVEYLDEYDISRVYMCSSPSVFILFGGNIREHPNYSFNSLKGVEIDYEVTIIEYKGYERISERYDV